MTQTDLSAIVAQLLGTPAPELPPVLPRPRPAARLPAPWPVLNHAARHGLAGDVLRLIDPTTEADPIAVLVNFLLSFGNAAGRSPHLRVGHARHGTNEFALLVGDTAKARKGSSRDGVRALMQLADPAWCLRLGSGLSTGEGLIWAVRDPIARAEPIKERGRPTGEMEQIVADPGVADKRLFIEEEEFSTVLRQSERAGNTLSEVIRAVWDARPQLQVMTKTSSAVATDAHISIIGHVTAAEYRRRLSTTEQANGLANRFLLFCVTRSKVQAFLPMIDEGLLSSLSSELSRLLDRARQRTEMPFSPEARTLWEELYPQVSEPLLNHHGAMIARSETHALRLALIYALVDDAAAITPAHLQASCALIDYARDSVRWVFQDTLPDPLAERIAALVAEHGELDGRGLHAALHAKYTASELSQAITALVDAGRITQQMQPTGGRPRLVLRAT